MKLCWQRLQNQSGHEAGLTLLEAMFREETGRALPTIEKTPQGKPFFPEEAFHFSISHTKSHVFCCLSEENVGIDAEEADRDINLRLADKILSPFEKELFDFIDTKYPEVPKAIREEKQMSEETEATLIKAIEEFKKEFRG